MTSTQSLLPSAKAFVQSSFIILFVENTERICCDSKRMDTKEHVGIAKERTQKSPYTKKNLIYATNNSTVYANAQTSAN
jgi:hypothetical protein